MKLPGIHYPRGPLYSSNCNLPRVSKGTKRQRHGQGKIHRSKPRNTRGQIFQSSYGEMKLAGLWMDPLDGPMAG